MSCRSTRVRTVLMWKLTEAERVSIKELWAAWLPMRLLGREAGVPYSTVRGYVRVLACPAPPPGDHPLSLRPAHS